jgi:hypothetical protein
VMAQAVAGFDPAVERMVGGGAVDSESARQVATRVLGSRARARAAVGRWQPRTDLLPRSRQVSHAAATWSRPAQLTDTTALVRPTDDSAPRDRRRVAQPASTLLPRSHQVALRVVQSEARLRRRRPLEPIVLPKKFRQRFMERVAKRLDFS